MSNTLKKSLASTTPVTMPISLKIVFLNCVLQHRVRARWEGMDQDNVFQRFKKIGIDHAHGHAHILKIAFFKFSFDSDQRKAEKWPGRLHWRSSPS